MELMKSQKRKWKIQIWKVGEKKYEMESIDSGVPHSTDSIFRKREQRKLRKNNQRNNLRNSMECSNTINNCKIKPHIEAHHHEGSGHQELREHSREVS